jgi:N-acylneuraminate cytidylyltransferase
MLVAVIPARGGSKRIPRKNIRKFGGKPMIAHSIDCALQGRLFDRVIVSTDDEEIAAVAREVGAEVPFMRPPELSDDHAATIPVIAHAVEWLRSNGADPTAVCCIYATAPFIDPDDLRKGWAVLAAGPWQYVFSATTFGYPIFRSFQRHPDGGLQMFFPEHFATRSQDLPEAMHDAGQFYWGQPHAWLGHLKLFEKWSTTVEIPRWRVQDIDTLDDWSRAELMSRYLSAEADVASVSRRRGQEI